MDDDINSSVDDLLDQLQTSAQVTRDIKNNDNFKLESEDLQEFLLQYSGKLIKGSVEFVDEVTQYITNAPDAKDVESLSKLVGASAAAIETLNKIHIANEKNKSINTVNYFLNKLLSKNFNRSDLIIGVGGGITGDVIGFVASIFKRGINFINIPTTLLAQVDSAIGGKTGVNSNYGKNLIGSFN